MPLGLPLHICDIFFRCLRAVTQETAQKVPAAAFHTFLEPLYDLLQFSPNKVSSSSSRNVNTHPDARQITLGPPVFPQHPTLYPCTHVRFFSLLYRR
jgi:hypothetical protein